MNATQMILATMRRKPIEATVIPFVAAANDPTELTWTEVSNQRVTKLIDDNFYHYESDFATTTGEITEIIGDADSQVGDNLQVSGTSLYQTTSAPVVNWFGVEMIIAGMASAGTYQRLGPAVIKDDTHFVSAVYDNVQGKFFVIVNGSIVLTKTHTVDPVGLKITMTVMKDAINVWAQEDGGSLLFVGYIMSDVTGAYMGVPANLDGYKYGVYCSQDSVGNHQISSLKGGAAGGQGIWNQRFVQNHDGSPYINDEGKYLITADWAALAELDPEGQSYRCLHQCVFSLDIDTYAIECVGHIYVQRSDSEDATIRYHGGADCKLTWYESENKWLFTTVLCDDYDPDVAPQIDDPYLWLDPLEPFGELIIHEDDFNFLGIDRGVNANLIYDVSNIRFIDDEFVILGAETDIARGSFWTLVTPIMLKGPALDNITSITRYATDDFLELCSWVYVNRTHFPLFTGHGIFNHLAFDMNLELVGSLDLDPLPADAGFIEGIDATVIQRNHTTRYLLIHFNTQTVTLTDVDDVTKEFIYSFGDTTIFLSDQISQGYEYE